MSNDRYQEIRDALAMGPTPGPWRADGFEVMAARGQFYGGLILGADDVVVAQMVSAANAPLIAACDSDTTRALLEERDALAAEVERLRAEVERLRGLAEKRRVLLCEVTGAGMADRALLRQALEALERGAWDTLSGRNAAFAIRERLGLGQEESHEQ
jgi:hypothetical protein